MDRSMQDLRLYWRQYNRRQRRTQRKWQDLTFTYKSPMRMYVYG